MIESSEANSNFGNDTSNGPENGSGKGGESADHQEGAGAGAPATSTAPTDDSLKKKIQELEGQVKEKENKYLYLYAEFENFKRRSTKERADLVKFGCETLVRDLLQNVDDMERALSHVSPGTDRALHEGLIMIHNQLKSTLLKQGVQPITSLNAAFDPNLHEAVGQEDSDLPAGTVIKEHSRGYTLHGRLLRPARVVLSGGSKETQGQ